MSSADLPPLLRLPLHTIAQVLSHFDTIQELGPLILSHSIFLDALQDNLHFVASAIVTRQAPDGTLPFLVALARSKKISPENALAKDLLASTVSSCPVALPTLGLPIAAYAFMSKSCSSAETICREMASELLRLHYRTPGTPRRGSASPEERIRIYRAIFRYQFMCNLFCHRVCLVTRQELKPRFEDEELKLSFFSSFSPWVNEELMCVFVYLRRKVAQAYDDIITHDVWLNHLKIEDGPDVNFISHIHWMLCMGLPFLSKIVSGASLRRTNILQFSTGRPATRAYNPHTILLCSRLRREQLSLNPPLRNGDLTLGKWSSQQISQLDPQREPQTSAFLAWKAAHLRSPITQAVCCDADLNLWFVGYVIWSMPGATTALLQRIYDDLRRREATFPRPSKEWEKDDLLRSRRQRKDICAAGGRGYWPREGGDWSEITGLTEDQQEALKAKWRREGVEYSRGAVAVKKREGDNEPMLSRKRRATRR